MLKAGAIGLGGSLGGPTAASMAGSVADKFIDIVGMGTYHIEKNSLTTNNSPIRMHADNGTLRVRHTEFVSEIFSATAFTTEEYGINPGLSITFPWLANLAQSYETYALHGMVVVYKPLSAMAVGSTNVALGSVVIATQYDADADPFESRREMESYMYTTASVPFEHQMHPVECAPRYQVMEEQYIRYGAVPQDLRWTDVGRLTVGVEGCQTNGDVLGELWVSYDVEFQKPRMEPSGLSTASYVKFSSGAYDNTDILSLQPQDPVGNLAITVSATGAGYDTISLDPLLDSGYYLILGCWQGSVTASITTSVAYTNMVAVTSFDQDSISYINNSNTTDSLYMFAKMVRVSGKNASFVFSGATLPTSGQSVDIYVIQVGSGVDPDLLVSYHLDMMGRKVFSARDTLMIDSDEKEYVQDLEDFPRENPYTFGDGGPPARPNKPFWGKHDKTSVGKLKNRR